MPSCYGLVAASSGIADSKTAANTPVFTCFGPIPAPIAAFYPRSPPLPRVRLPWVRSAHARTIGTPAATGPRPVPRSSRGPPPSRGRNLRNEATDVPTTGGAYTLGAWSRTWPASTAVLAAAIGAAAELESGPRHLQENGYSLARFTPNQA